MLDDKSNVSLTRPVDAGKPNIAVGILVGLCVALLSSLIWYAVVVVTNLQLGIIAVVVGLLVGLGMLKGAGGRSSRLLQFSAVVITILAMGLSEYLIVNHLVNKSLEAEGKGRYLPLLISPSGIAEYVYLGLKSDPLTLVFWAIAVYEAFKILRPREGIKQKAGVIQEASDKGTLS
jgi:hypothetical protein